MSIKDIMVHVDTGFGNENRIRVAIDLATRHSAQLTGIYAISRPVIPSYAEVQIADEILRAQASALRETADRAKSDFLAMTNTVGLAAEWLCFEGAADTILSREAVTSDILIVGQHDPNEDIFPGGRDMPDHVILSTGRPVLVIPNSFNRDDLGRRIMVAWDGSARATRAVHDAMAFLQMAEYVCVMVANPEEEVRIGTEPASRITDHLIRHGVRAEAAHMTNRRVQPGELLLSRAADLSVDMIVCGAYGHARWKELILGGVTDHLLDHMPVPLLMSH